MRVLGLAFSHYEDRNVDALGPSMYFILELEIVYDLTSGTRYFKSVGPPLTRARPRDAGLVALGDILSKERGLPFKCSNMAGAGVDLSDMELLALSQTGALT